MPSTFTKLAFLIFGLIPALTLLVMAAGVWPVVFGAGVGLTLLGLRELPANKEGKTDDLH